MSTATPRKKKPFPLWGWLIIGVAVMIGCGAVGTLAITAYQTNKNAGDVGAKPIPREEFDKLVKGKTKPELLDLLGKPSRTDGSAADDTWVYEGRTYDTVNGRTDTRVWIRFHGGKVSSVDF